MSPGGWVADVAAAAAAADSVSSVSVSVAVAAVAAVSWGFGEIVRVVLQSLAGLEFC